MPKITANNIDIYYERHGKGQPLVLVGGFSVDHKVWQSVIEPLKNNFEVIVFDNRGAGQTDCPDLNYTIEMMVDDTIALCSALHLDACHFIGSSMGGAIVQTIAHKFPEKVLTAIIENSFMHIDIRFALKAKGHLSAMQAGISQRTLTEISLGWAFSSNFLNQGNMAESIITLSLANPFPFTEVGYRNQLQALLNFNSEQWLSKIKAPCLVMGSDKDMITYEEHMKQMAQLIPNAQYYSFKGVGHVPHIEQPELFCEVVNNYIETKNSANA